MPEAQFDLDTLIDLDLVGFWSPRGSPAKINYLILTSMPGYYTDPFELSLLRLNGVRLGILHKDVDQECWQNFPSFANVLPVRRRHD
jgi:hypothetical protein